MCSRVFGHFSFKLLTWAARLGMRSMAQFPDTILDMDATMADPMTIAGCRCNRGPSKLLQTKSRSVAQEMVEEMEGQCLMCLQSRVESMGINGYIKQSRVFTGYIKQWQIFHCKTLQTFSVSLTLINSPFHQCSGWRTQTEGLVAMCHYSCIAAWCQEQDSKERLWSAYHAEGGTNYV